MENEVRVEEEVIETTENHEGIETYDLVPTEEESSGSGLAKAGLVALIGGGIAAAVIAKKKLDKKRQEKKAEEGLQEHKLTLKERFLGRIDIPVDVAEEPVEIEVIDDEGRN